MGKWARILVGLTAANVCVGANEPLVVDVRSREEVRQFYLALNRASSEVPHEWNGDVAAGIAGTTSVDFKDAVALRINMFRALAGVPPHVVIDESLSAKAQQAALMMSANKQLSHNPPQSWLFYSPDGAIAAANSNLALQVMGPDAITGFIRDPGSSNNTVGHRRWLLYPKFKTTGTGDVPSTASGDAANVTWVLNNDTGQRPSTREAFVAWPPPGYTPHDLVSEWWSFTYPSADFSSATLTVTRDGSAIAVQKQPVQNGYGENTLVWTDNPNSEGIRVTTDTTFHVSISNVLINGSARSFEYDVKLFDPNQVGPDAILASATGPADVVAQVPTSFTVVRPAFANTVQWRILELDVPSVAGAETDLDGLVPSTTGTYNPRCVTDVALGSASYQLAHGLAPRTQQSLALPGFYRVPDAASGAKVSFLSKLGIAGSAQYAKVQVSSDDGRTWTDIYSQRGNNPFAPETQFTRKDASLEQFQGKVIKLRFVYDISGGSIATQTGAGYGWFFDDVKLEGVPQVVAFGNPVTTSASTFNYTPSALGSRNRAIEVRGILFGAYAMEWGPVKQVNVAAFANSPTHRSVTLGSSAEFLAQWSGSQQPVIRWQRNGSEVSGGTTSTLTVPNVQPASTGLYTAVGTIGGSVSASEPAILGIETNAKVTGAGEEIGSNIFVASNGNTYDQVILQGEAVTIRSDHDVGQITRTSYIDFDGDIVQVEFSGPGTLTIVLENQTPPALPEKYNQDVRYVKGHAGIVITGATEQTNVSVFSVGKITAINQALFKPEVTYDGFADISFIAIASVDGKFGGIRTGNASYYNSKGVTGIYAPGVQFVGPIFVGNIDAFDSAQSMILTGGCADARVAGGDLLQSNGRPVRVSGISQLKFTAGTTSHGANLPAQANRADLQQDGVSVTSSIVVNP